MKIPRKPPNQIGRAPEEGERLFKWYSGSKKYISILMKKYLSIYDKGIIVKKSSDTIMEICWFEISERIHIGCDEEASSNQCHLSI